MRPKRARERVDERVRKNVFLNFHSSSHFSIHFIFIFFVFVFHPAATDRLTPLSLFKFFFFFSLSYSRRLFCFAFCSSFFISAGFILNFLPITDFFNFASRSQTRTEKENDVDAKKEWTKENHSHSNPFAFFRFALMPCVRHTIAILCLSFFVEKKNCWRIPNTTNGPTHSFGTQQPIALLKLLFEKGGMFDCDRDLKWKIFKDVCYFCAMTTPGGDRNELDARFVSLCAPLNINRPTDAIAFTIYKSILRGHLVDFAPDLHPITDTLIKMTLRLFKVSVSTLYTRNNVCVCVRAPCISWYVNDDSV